METLAFQNITKQCHDITNNYLQNSNFYNKNDVSVTAFKKLYYGFLFEFFHYKNQEQVNKYLQNYLQEFKFIAYGIFNFPINFIQEEKHSISTSNAIICVENKCLIIKNIDNSSIDQILKTSKSSIININQRTSENANIFEEIENFCQLFIYLKNKTNANEFINSTLRVLSCYTIRRFFYPSNFFKDQSFFTFDKYINSTDEYIQSNLKKIIQNENENEMKTQLKSFQNEIIEKIEIKEPSPKIYEFKEYEFHNLRLLSSKTNVSINLAIHIKSFYVFVVKSVLAKTNDVINHEDDFIRNYSNKYFTRFYGFIKDSSNITRFVYEFMSNGNLLNIKHTSTLFPFTTTIRLFQGIKYLHSNKLIHRDLKPSNILIDHNFVPYISDYETIRRINDDQNKNEIFTLDIGSLPYASPEQIYNLKISYSTDIYSFGAIIYYLFEKKDMLNKNENYQINSFYDKIKEGKNNKIKNASSIIQYIYDSSIKYNANDRISLNEIENEISKEIMSFSYIEEFMKEEIDSKDKMTELIQYLQECILFQFKYQDSFKNLFNDSLFHLLQAKNDQSEIAFQLGEIYFDGKLVKKNYMKAKEYYEIAAKFNNSEALFSLGFLYGNGYGVEKDYSKTKEYFELSAKMNNTKAINGIATLYYNGYGVEKDYSKAKELYELSIKINNSAVALYRLGLFYFNGIIVKKDYIKAKELFELSAEQNEPDALYILAFVYFCGYGVEKDENKFLKYVKLAAELDSPTAFSVLGFLYYEGLLVDIDYSKAKEYFEKAIESNDSFAFLFLGHIYIKDYSDEKNYLKAIKYYEKSAELNNSKAFESLGNLYCSGQFIPVDFTKAKEYFEKSVELFNTDALLNLGHLYLNESYNQKDYKLAKLYFELSAENNNPYGYLNLGNIYFLGIGVNENYSKAIEYFEKAADLECPEAFLALGDFYYNGYGVQKNLSKAREYYEIAAQKKIPDAFRHLHDMYLYGKGVPLNISKAKEYSNMHFELMNSMNNQNNLSIENIPIKLPTNESLSDNNKSYTLVNLGNNYFYGINVKQNFKKAFEYYELSAKLNNPVALSNLGNMYFYGNGVCQDLLEAKKYYELSIKQNNYGPACISLGRMYYDGIGIPQDFSKAKEYFELAAMQHNQEAYLLLGDIFLYGNGVEQNFEIAKKYYELAARQNNPFAFLNLGNLYYNGLGVKQNFIKAKEYYEVSAKKNISDANLNLGNMYYYGQGVEKNLSKAKEYYEVSARQNNSIALENLGLLYLNGNGVEQNYLIAKEYLELSAKQNNPFAFNILGDYFYGIEKNYKKAKEYYEYAGMYNIHNALCNLSFFYLNGLGVEPNYSKGLEILEFLANQKNPIAINELGNIYLYGKIVHQSFENAKKYYEMAATMNFPYAFLNLGDLYFNGYGVLKNYKKAKYFYELAAKQNLSESFNMLGDIYLKGLGVERNYKKAIEYYELSANQYNPYAFLNLGAIYFNGFGVQKNYKKAKYYYELASKQQIPDAFNLLGIIYENGYGVVKDLARAKFNYKKAIKFNNPHALYNLGLYYLNEKNGKKKISKAIKYFQLAIKQRNPFAMYTLGCYYYNNVDKKDFKKSIYYLELSVKYNMLDAFPILAFIYMHGINVEIDIKKGYDLYEVSAKANNVFALSYLGYEYSSGEIFKVDLNKSIDYFLKCLSMLNNDVKYNSNNKYFWFTNNVFSEGCCYIACNDLGLIYLLDLNDIQKAENYLKKSAFNEFQYGQYCFGLFCYFYLDQKENAVHMLKCASKKNFALAEYFIGYLEEKDSNIKKAIEFYEKASEHQDEPIKFCDILRSDPRLNISIIFILCLTNLKLVEYFFSQSKYEESKKYFIKSLSKFHLSDKYNVSYQFELKFDNNNIKKSFSYLKQFILDFPMFDPKKNPYYYYSFISETKSELNNEKVTNKSLIKYNEKINFEKNDSKNIHYKSSFIDFENEIKITDIDLQQNVVLNEQNDLIFDDPGAFFDFVIKNKEFKDVFIYEIKDIIDTMNKMLYTQPYFILFGKMSIEKTKYIIKQDKYPNAKNINNSFYEGFSIDS